MHPARPSLRARVALLVVASLAVISGSAPPRHAAADAPFGVAVMRDVMVPMRDGIKLATDVYRPATNGSPAEGKFPAIMERTPYNKDGIAATAAYFVPRGYIVIAQDVRSRYKSEGHWRPIADDPNDGFDTAKWLGLQPWFDGNLGTVGRRDAARARHRQPAVSEDHDPGGRDVEHGSLRRPPQRRFRTAVLQLGADDGQRGGRTECADRLHPRRNHTRGG